MKSHRIQKGVEALGLRPNATATAGEAEQCPVGFDDCPRAAEVLDGFGRSVYHKTMLLRILTSFLAAVVLFLGVLPAVGMTFAPSSTPAQPRQCCQADKGCCTCCAPHHAFLSTISVCSCEEDAVAPTMLEPGLTETSHGTPLLYPVAATVRDADTSPARGYERPSEKPPPV